MFAPSAAEDASPTVDWVGLNTHVRHRTYGTRVVRLHITHCDIADSPWKWLVGVVPALANLADLDMSFTDLGDARCAQLMSALSTPPAAKAVDHRRTLVSLAVAGNRLTHRSAQKLGRFVVKSRALQVLDLSHNTLSDHGLQIVAAHLAHAPLSFVNLNVANNASGIRGIVDALVGASGAPALQDISLAHNSHDPDATAVSPSRRVAPGPSTVEMAMASYDEHHHRSVSESTQFEVHNAASHLHHMPQRSLSPRHASAAKRRAEVLPRNSLKQMRLGAHTAVLNLCGCALTAQHALDLVPAVLSACPRLEALWMHDNAVGDAACYALQATIQASQGGGPMPLQQLSILDLSLNGVTDTGLEHIAEALACGAFEEIASPSRGGPQPMPRLEELCVAGNHVTADGIARFLASLYDAQCMSPRFGLRGQLRIDASRGAAVVTEDDLELLQRAVDLLGGRVVVQCGPTTHADVVDVVASDVDGLQPQRAAGTSTHSPPQTSRDVSPSSSDEGATPRTTHPLASPPLAPSPAAASPRKDPTPKQPRFADSNSDFFGKSSSPREPSERPADYSQPWRKSADPPAAPAAAARTTSVEDAIDPQDKDFTAPPTPELSAVEADDTLITVTQPTMVLDPVPSLAAAVPRSAASYTPVSAATPSPPPDDVPVDDAPGSPDGRAPTPTESSASTSAASAATSSGSGHEFTMDGTVDELAHASELADASAVIDAGLEGGSQEPSSPVAEAAVPTALGPQPTFPDAAAVLQSAREDLPRIAPMHTLVFRHQPGHPLCRVCHLPKETIIDPLSADIQEACAAFLASPEAAQEAKDGQPLQCFVQRVAIYGDGAASIIVKSNGKRQVVQKVLPLLGPADAPVDEADLAARFPRLTAIARWLQRGGVVCSANDGRDLTTASAECELRDVFGAYVDQAMRKDGSERAAAVAAFHEQHANAAQLAADLDEAGAFAAAAQAAQLPSSCGASPSGSPQHSMHTTHDATHDASLTAAAVDVTNHDATDAAASAAAAAADDIAAALAPTTDDASSDAASSGMGELRAVGSGAMGDSIADDPASPQFDVKPDSFARGIVILSADGGAGSLVLPSAADPDAPPLHAFGINVRGVRRVVAAVSLAGADETTPQAAPIQPPDVRQRSVEPPAAGAAAAADSNPFVHSPRQLTQSVVPVEDDRGELGAAAVRNDDDDDADGSPRVQSAKAAAKDVDVLAPFGEMVAQRAKTLARKSSPDQRPQVLGRTLSSTDSDFVVREAELAAAAERRRIARAAKLFEAAYAFEACGKITLPEQDRNKRQVCRGTWAGRSVTVSVEWNDFLVVKEAGTLSKELLHVHPLAGNTPRHPLCSIGAGREVVLLFDRPPQQPSPDGAPSAVRMLSAPPVVSVPVALAAEFKPDAVRTEIERAAEASLQRSATGAVPPPAAA